MLGRETRTYGATWASPNGFAAYVADLIADSDEDHPRPDGWVPCTTLWWVDGKEYLARIVIRHRLTDVLRNVGGHIGYYPAIGASAGTRDGDAPRGAPCRQSTWH
jgi:predicted acetyltransferase